MSHIISLHAITTRAWGLIVHYLFLSRYLRTRISRTGTLWLALSLTIQTILIFKQHMIYLSSSFFLLSSSFLLTHFYFFVNTISLNPTDFFHFTFLVDIWLEYGVRVEEVLTSTLPNRLTIHSSDDDHGVRVSTFTC